MTEGGGAPGASRERGIRVAERGTRFGLAKECPVGWRWIRRLTSVIGPPSSVLFRFPIYVFYAFFVANGLGDRCRWPR